jgi:DNA polymerase III subunit beta
MKLSIERAALLKCISHVQSVVERRNTIPILSNILITAEDDVVRLSATDLDIEITDAVDAKVQRGGSLTAPAHTLYEIIRKLPDGMDVKLEAPPGEPRLSLVAGRSRFALPVLPASDFPMMKSEDFKATFSMERADLARLIDKTRFAISTEETRYYLNGIFFHSALEKGGPLLRAVATDGHRLALAEQAAPDGADGMPSVILPRKTVHELRRLLDDAGGEVQVSVSETKVAFTLGQARLVSKVIEGAFPDYGRVIPRDNQRMMRVENKAFAAAVDRVATISAEKSRSVKMALDSDRLTLTVNNPETGLATEEVAATCPPEAFEIGFNARYLLDVTGQIAGDEAQFEFGDPASPTLVRDLKDPHALFVLMPLRV